MVVTWTRRVAGQIVKYCILFQVADSGPILKVGFAGRFDVELWGGMEMKESRRHWKGRDASRCGF